MEQARDQFPERRGPSAKVKKPRGRPPVTPQNDTPADRRRMQLRHAQRAYRQRKDDQITTLQKKVEQLQAAAKAMSDSFHQFGASAIASSTLSLRPKLESELRSTAATLTALHDATTAVTEDDTAASLPCSTTAHHSPMLAGDNYQPVAPGNPSSTSQPQDIGSSQALPFGYVITYETSDDDDAKEVSNDRPVPPVRTLPPPYTYSFRETTFANRLERACIERGVHILSSLHLRPSEFQRSYRICRHLCTRERLLTKFKEVLAKPVLTSLNKLNLSVGGAGTHFPRARDGNNNAIWTAPGTGGDFRSDLRAILESFGLHSTPEFEADLCHYDGVWFDTQDVEGYLAELGVNVDAHGSLAEIEIEPLKMQGISLSLKRARRLAGSAGCQGPHRASLRETDANTSLSVAGVMPGVTVEIANDLSEEEWNRFCNFSTPWLAEPIESAGEFFRREWDRHSAIIDLGRLVNGLVKRSVCIGRGPGFRLEDVNGALRAAVIDP